MRRLLALESVLLALSLLGASPAAAFTGAENYAFACATCHGPTAAGDGPQVPFLTILPPNLAACEYRFDADGDLAFGTDNDLFLVARDGAAAYGGLSIEMAPWGLVFTDPQLLDIIAHIRTLEPIPCPEPHRDLLALSALGSLLALGAFRRTRAA